jgi:hypothetical protein
MKKRIILIGLLVGTMFSAPATGQTNEQFSTPPKIGESLELKGMVQVIWGDPPPGSDLPESHHYELVTERGKTWFLDLDRELVESAGGLLALSQSQVTASGRVTRISVPQLAVETIERTNAQAEDEAKILTGSQRYIWILLRFSDNSSTPQPTYWFMDQALGDRPSMDHYWREVSYNNINVQGSVVLGWYNLPHPRSYYVYDIDPQDEGDELDGARTLNDAIALADPYVDFTDYVGFHMCFNDVLDCCSYGGQSWLTLDGETRYWNVTWLADWGWGNQDVIAHETGHSLGWPHSSGPYGDIYDSHWDVMSKACGECNQTDPDYGNLAINGISYHKDQLGWIHPLHQYTAPTTPVVTSLWLNDLAVVPPLGRMLMAKIHWSTDYNQFFTIERRRWTGYDAGLPDQTVVIHMINPFRDNPAWVVDPDMMGDPNDEGARWDKGETFWDSTNHVVVTVEDSDGTGSLITLSNAAQAIVYVNYGNSGYESGSSIYPWNTTYEGYGAVLPTGTVYITPGTYNTQETLLKPATLRRWGSSGVVTLGN